MANINDFFNNWKESSHTMGDWKKDPKKERIKFYLAIFISNIAVNILYLLTWIIADWWKTRLSIPYELLSWVFWVFTDYFPISIFIIIQILVTVYLVKWFLSGKIATEKESLVWLWNNINLIMFIVLLNAWIGTYLWSQSLVAKLDWLWLVLLILTTIWLYFWSRRIFDILKEVLSNFVKWEDQLVEEEEERPLENYDWFKEYYSYNLSQRKWNPVTEHILAKKLPYYRFTIADRLSKIIWMINQTLMIEQPRLISKQVLELQNTQTYIQVDYPLVNSRDEMNSVLEKLEFSNKYFKINNSFLALKLRTQYLSSEKYLQEKVWDEILVNQRLEQFKQITFSPKKPYSKDSEDYKQMMSECKRPYTLFQNISIEKLEGEWYVVLNFSKWYRRTVIFPQLDTLTKTLEKQGIEQFDSTPNPLIYFWIKAVGWLLGLNLKRIKHLLFWWESWSWKSVFLNSILYQLLYRSTPKSVNLVLIDPLKVSFQKLKKIKNLIYPLASTEEEVIKAIKFLKKLQEDRYSFLEKLGWYEDIYSYNSDIKEKIIQLADETGLPTKYRLPGNSSFKYSNLDEIDEKMIERKSTTEYKLWEILTQVVVIYDEFNAYNWSFLYEKQKSVDTLIKLSEQARKAWIILILWTQKISADSVPSALREQLATKICLTVWSKANSRAILWDWPDNKWSWVTLSGYWDSLVYHKTELDSTAATRSQGFYVSDNEMNLLIKDNLDVFWQNDFIYQEWDINEYSWLKDFFSIEEIDYESWEKLSKEIIKRNLEENEKNRLNLWNTLPLIINSINNIFKLQRDKLLDKNNLAEASKNIKIDTPLFSTEREMLDRFKTLGYSNSYYQVTKSFINIRLNTLYLDKGESLLKLSEIIDRQLESIKKKITFSPLKPYPEGSSEEIKMINTFWVKYPLFLNFQIVQIWNKFYLQINYTVDYKNTVIFPQSETIRQILTKKFWEKIEKLLKGKKTTIEDLK